MCAVSRTSESTPMARLCSLLFPKSPTRANQVGQAERLEDCSACFPDASRRQCGRKKMTNPGRNRPCRSDLRTWIRTDDRSRPFIRYRMTGAHDAKAGRSKALSMIRAFARHPRLGVSRPRMKPSRAPTTGMTVCVLVRRALSRALRLRSLLIWRMRLNPIRGRRMRRFHALSPISISMRRRLSPPRQEERLVTGWTRSLRVHSPRHSGSKASHSWMIAR